MPILRKFSKSDRVEICRVEVDRVQTKTFFDCMPFRCFKSLLNIIFFLCLNLRLNEKLSLKINFFYNIKNIQFTDFVSISNVFS